MSQEGEIGEDGGGQECVHTTCICTGVCACMCEKGEGAEGIDVYMCVNRCLVRVVKMYIVRTRKGF